MPMPFVKIKENENKIENMQINTTTKQRNEETNNLLTSLQRKPKEKNKEKEGIFEQFMNKFSNAIKMKEPGWMSHHLPGEHTEKMLNIGIGITIFSMWSAVGALFAHMAGSQIVTEVLAFTALFSLCVGVSIAAIATLMD